VNNKPLLFVNSITKNELGNENQLVYDSRKYHKGRVLHRIDDILGFMNLGKKVYVFVLYFDKNYYGEVFKIDSNTLSVKNSENISFFLLNNIKDLKIERIL
jgi:hypothetical protein